MTSGRAAASPGIVVPDELSLTVWGHDPAERGIEPTGALAGARRLLVADPLPKALTGPLAALRAQLPERVDIEIVAVELPGTRATEALDVPEPTGANAGQGGHGGHGAHADRGGDGHGGHDAGAMEMHGGHGGHHDHGDMMEISGEPSADGLVMEPIEFEHGPLSPYLPGGLVLAVTLDGDVVADCEARATLRLDEAARDPLARAASAMAFAEAGAADDSPADRWRRLAAVEIERALSHAAWMRSFARLLGWPALTASCQTVVSTLILARSGDRSLVEAAARRARDLAKRTQSSRALRARTRGRGVVEDAEGLHGPPARACGLVDDARLEHPLYDALGFQPALHDDGDAYARTLLRVAECREAVDLAAAAFERLARGEPGPQARSGTVEGPRGPVSATRHGPDLELSAPGGEAALRIAGRAAVGHEWAAALVAVASFDLSPWTAGG